MIDLPVTSSVRTLCSHSLTHQLLPGLLAELTATGDCTAGLGFNHCRQVRDITSTCCAVVKVLNDAELVQQSSQPPRNCVFDDPDPGSFPSS